ncbi:mitotic interactor and substrate of PLK1 [Tachyglossus aculeatus]|uniref:mitotic interactor and substrate of PLK1 n=1 Tax=Tachyglossus aculeatus TaxID=9261 RepID=UPI0018F71472|nr:mitotic interactor and substrate of PLK1 [Tachyglossus aculeatus]
MDRVTRYQIFSIPHSPGASSFQVEEESRYNFEAVGLRPESSWGGPSWNRSDSVLSPDGESSSGFGGSWEETPGLRVVTVTQEGFSGPRETLEATYVLTEEARHGRPLWSPGTVRESKLQVLETVPAYSPWANPMEYITVEENGEYRMGPGDGVPQGRGALEQERQEVIQSQVVKRNTTIVRRWSSQEELEKINGVDPEKVDTGQIDFLSARRQFMTLEKASANAGPTPSRGAVKSVQGGADRGWQSPQGSRVSSTRKTEVRSTPSGVGWPPQPPGWGASQEPGQAPYSPKGSAPRHRVGVPPGLRELAPEPPPGSSSGKGHPGQETPIEREIRLAQEREEELRQARGLRRPSSRDELVEIPSRPLLRGLALSSMSPGRGRDRGRLSLFVQREMVQETQREEEHRRGARREESPGSPTPSGPSRRRTTWRNCQLRRALSSDSILHSEPSQASNTSPEASPGRKVNRLHAEAYQPYLYPADPVGGRSSGHVSRGSRGDSWPKEREDLGGPQGWSPAQEPGVTGEKEILPLAREQQEVQRHWSTWESWEPQAGVPGQPRGVDPLPQGTVVRKEYFTLQPLKIKFTFAPGPGEPPSREFLQGRTLRPQASGLLEKEIQSVLQRERELAQERRSALFPEVFSPSSEAEEQTLRDGCWSRGSSEASGTCGSYSVSTSPVFTPINFHSELVWKVTPSARDPQIPDSLPWAETYKASLTHSDWEPVDDSPWRKKKELGYAGIDVSDNINTELVEATRVTRHKNTLAARWEAQIYSREEED